MDESKRFSAIEDVLTYFPGLVTVFSPYEDTYPARDKESRYVRLAHFSIQEYLMSTRMTQPDFAAPEQASHLQIADSCLAYHLQLSEKMLVDDEKCDQYSLWKYAVPCGLDHVDKIPYRSWTRSVTICTKLALMHELRSLLNIMRLHYPDYSAPDMGYSSGLFTSLYYAAGTENFQLVSFLIENGASVNEI